jgi:hypothetical protein
LRYRASVAHGLTLWLCTASADGGLWQRAEVAVTLAQRYAAAYADLDTPSALADISSSARLNEQRAPATRAIPR